MGNKEILDAKWAEADANPGQVVSIGDIVVCDDCDEDYTDKPDQGGIIFTGYAYCPKCTPKRLKDIQRFKEERFIKARCPEGVSFADFVRRYRGGDGTVMIIREGEGK